MGKIKVIDLLNMVSKGEKLPKKVRYVGVIFENKEGDLLNDNGYSLFEHRHNANEKLLPMLNDLVEIIEDTPKEDKKIEKLDLEELNELLKNDLSYNILFHDIHKMFVETKSTINEIIDKVNGEDND